MVYFEHAMLGLTLAVAAGTHRRHGPALPVTAAVAARPAALGLVPVAVDRARAAGAVPRRDVRHLSVAKAHDADRVGDAAAVRDVPRHPRVVGVACRGQGGWLLSLFHVTRWW